MYLRRFPCSEQQTTTSFIFIASFNFSIDFNCLGFDVIWNIKWLWNTVTIVLYLMLGLLKTFSNKICWLHLTDWEIYVILCNHKWVQRQEFWLISLAVCQLTKTTHNTCSIGLSFSLTIKTHTELNCKPIKCTQPFNFNFTCSQWC